MISRFLAAACACLCAWPALALVTRTDRDDAEYLELASRYTSALRLTAPAGEGVLIAPRWILTSAGSKAAARVRIGERDHAVRATFIHAESGVALLLLKEEVSTVEPTPIYRNRDEAGKGVVIAGHGGDGRKRAGINTIDAVEAKALVVRIKKGDDASDLQGALTPAELGAPAYLQVGDDLFVAGVATAISGDRETFARTSALADWIDETMFRAAVEEGKSAAPRRR